MFVVVYFRKDWSIIEVVSLTQKIMLKNLVFMPLTLGLLVAESVFVSSTGESIRLVPKVAEGQRN